MPEEKIESPDVMLPGLKCAKQNKLMPVPFQFVIKVFPCSSHDDDNYLILARVFVQNMLHGICQFIVGAAVINVIAPDSP